MSSKNYEKKMLCRRIEQSKESCAREIHAARNETSGINESQVHLLEKELNKRQQRNIELRKGLQASGKLKRGNGSIQKGRESASTMY